MKNIFIKSDLWTIALFMCLFFFSCESDRIIEIKGQYGSSNEHSGPYLFRSDLSESEIKAARENRLVVVEITGQEEGPEIAVQMSGNPANDPGLVALLPKGPTGKRLFKLAVKDEPLTPLMKVEPSDDKAHPVILEEGDKVLQYNYGKVHAKDVVRPGGVQKKLEYSKSSSGIYYDELLKSNPTYPKDTLISSSVYAVPRSDYIHPVYGLNGEMLTRDWPDGGHPHHRGIFWAWPEVEYNGERGDIYALQRVFARPTGNIDFIEGPVYAQVNAENRWMWEEEVPIVREHVSIRAYRSSPDARIIDLRLEFLALEEGVTLATRFTNSYGGLNIRMQTPENQEINYFTDEAEVDPRKAWTDFSGIFEGGNEASGMMVLQHKSNPEYPGEWVEYPNLSWVQPTFPTPESRFPLSTTKPLVLKYRFVVHRGGTPADQIGKARWDAFHAENSPEFE